MGGNGGRGLSEALRAKRFLEIISTGREEIQSVLQRFYTDSDSSFEGRASRTTVGNAVNTAQILGCLEGEMQRPIEKLDIVAAKIHLPRVIALYNKVLRGPKGYGFRDIQLVGHGVDIDYEPNNEQWFWHNSFYRSIDEIANLIYYLVSGIADRRLALKAVFEIFNPHS